LNLVNETTKFESKFNLFSPAVDKVVAQTSSLRKPDRPSESVMATFCRLEIGATAGWKPVGNLRYAELAGVCRGPAAVPSIELFDGLFPLTLSAPLE